MRLPKFKLPTRLSALIALGIILIIVIFVMGGGIYLLVSGSPFNNPYGTGLVSNSLSDQYGVETLLSVSFMFIGFFGFLLIYESTKHVYNASYATKLLILGIILILVAVVLLYWMLIPKTQWLFPWAYNSGL
jgi:divalent metal cation (Fe/Co/Zn/Cd) transporter